MRISIDPSDPGYKLGPQRLVRVFLDDVEMRYVITADDEAGMVVQYQRDGKGSLIVDFGLGECVCETLYGAVRFEVPA